MTLRTFWTQLVPFIKWLPACSMLLLSLSSLYNLVYQVQTLRQAKVQYEQQLTEVKKNEQELKNWRRALEYAKTDYFAERYARTELRMGRSGDILVFPHAVNGSPSGVPERVGQIVVWWNDFVK